MLRWIKSKFPGGRLAVVKLSGAISGQSAEEPLRSLKALEEMKAVKGVLVVIESPGGSASASEALYRRIRKLGEKKTVYAYAVMAASGGYMAACAAERIHAPSTGLVGSIGVITVKPVLREFLERIGISVEVTKSGRMKDMSLFHRESTEEELQSWKDISDSVHRCFIDMVAQGRSMPIEQVTELATGALFGAQRALSLGLIDEIGGFDETLEALGKKCAVPVERTFEIKPKRTLIKRLMADASVSFYDELLKRGF